MRKIIIMLTASFLILLSIPSFASSNTLSETQKDTLIRLGYPAEFRYQLDSWYSEIRNYSPYSYGSFTHFGVLCNFVSSMRYETNPNNLPQFAVVARGVYDEISNIYYDTELSMNGIWDSLTNRVESGDPNWSTYFDAASFAGLNSLNPNMGGEYWANQPVTNPLVDACQTGQTAKAMLVKAYTTSFRKFGLGANPGGSNFRFTNLPSDYYYFVETESYNPNSQIKIGAFVHSRSIE